ncbi:hypothetical protein [uncultured Paracoccus sp.]|uniref:hypothetical protein n=1 Tax=uncultured Paracoccus sp. TaxID=189685 RepID=UPI0025CE90BA|nr:hypothetical protein [uncultured Paracoccus sp.]
MTGRAAWLAVLAALSGPAMAQDLKPPLTAQVRFTTPEGADLAQVLPDQPFDVVLEFTAQVGSVPGDLAPMGWLRQRGPSDLPCGETAAAYRATGRASIGSVDLNGVVLGVAARDGAFTVLDPQRALGTANLLAARRLDAAPASVVADPSSGRFLVSLTDAGQVLAMTPYGDMQVLAQGLDRPGALVPAASGGAWLLEEGSGDILRPGRDLHLDLDAWAIAGDGGTQPTQRLAVQETDSLTVLGDDGTVLARTPAPGALAVGLNRDAGLWLGPTALHVLWLDAPDQAQAIPLDGHFDRMAVSPEGRMVLVYAQDRTGFAMVDLATGRVVPAANTDSPVAEVAFLPGTAVLRLADGATIGVMDLDPIQPGAEATLGRVVIGAAQSDAPDALLLAPLLPEPAMLAVHADSYAGFVVDARHAISGKPPMEALRLRGGIPQIVRALDRGLRPTGPGQFTAAARLPRPGPWELVISAGIGQMAFCAALPTPPAPHSATQAPGRIQPRVDGEGGLRLLFTTGDGAPAAGLTGVIDLAALTGNWRIRQTFTTGTDGLTAERWTLGDRLPLVVTTRAGFAPLVLEDVP